ncbi:hypothetical protein ACTHAM_002341 [Cellulomonas soli]|uniref:hypothetical protein n=1 Tax=Cellulomonas soli TaxID=931535 RepID=UPI003F852C30
MSTTTDTPNKRQLSDLVVALLRTAVPAWWGTVVTWLLATTLNYLPTELGDALAVLLSSDVAVGLVVTVAIALWYLVWRWLSPRVPDWLVRLALGSVRTPSYAPAAVVGELELQGIDQAVLEQLRATLADIDETDPAVEALDRILTT